MAAPRSQPQPPSAPLPVGIRLGAADLLGFPGTRSGIVERLAKYSLAELSDYLGRISAVLNYPGWRELEVQGRLVAELFPRSTALSILNRLSVENARLRFEDHDGRATPFTDQALHAIWQFVPDAIADAAGPPTGTDRYPLGEALLMVQDLVGEADGRLPESVDFNDPESLKRWTHFVGIEASTLSGGVLVHRVARAIDLFMTPHPEESSRPDYIDLPTVVERTLGISGAGYALGMQTLLGYCSRVHAANFTSESLTLPRDWYGPVQSLLPDSRADALLAIGGLTAEDFLQQLHSYYDNRPISGKRHLPLELSPLVRFKDTASCLSPALLEARLTDGLYHVILSALPDRDRARFFRYVGFRWERIVDAAMIRIARHRGPASPKRKGRPQALGRWIPGAEVDQALDRIGFKESPNRCDGILLIGNTAILAECKAKMLPLDVRSGLNPAAFFERFEETIVGAAVQLDATVAHIAAGRFAALGLSSATVSVLCPIVVSLQPFAQDAVFRHYLKTRLADRGLLGSANVGDMGVLPLEVLSPNDFETMELVNETDVRTPAKLLLEKWRHGAEQDVGVANWVHATGLLDGQADPVRLKHHTAVFKHVGELAKGFLRQAKDSGRADHG